MTLKSQKRPYIFKNMRSLRSNAIKRSKLDHSCRPKQFSSLRSYLNQPSHVYKVLKSAKSPAKYRQIKSSGVSTHHGVSPPRNLNSYFANVFDSLNKSQRNIPYSQIPLTLSLFQQVSVASVGRSTALSLRESQSKTLAMDQNTSPDQPNVALPHLNAIDSDQFEKYLSTLSLHVKHLDKLDTTISGNKYFKLKYNLQAILAQYRFVPPQINPQLQDTAFVDSYFEHCDVGSEQMTYIPIITFGGAFSNHIAAFSGLVAKLNESLPPSSVDTPLGSSRLHIRPIFIIRGEELAMKPLNSTLCQMVSELGPENVDILFVSRITYNLRHDPTFLSSLQQRCATRDFDWDPRLCSSSSQAQSSKQDDRFRMIPHHSLASHMKQVPSIAEVFTNCSNSQSEGIKLTDTSTVANDDQLSSHRDFLHFPPHIIPEGGTALLALSGTREILSSFDLSTFSTISTAVGTAGTFAGLVLAHSEHIATFQNTQSSLFDDSTNSYSNHRRNYIHHHKGFAPAVYTSDILPPATASELLPPSKILGFCAVPLKDIRLKNAFNFAQQLAFPKETHQPLDLMFKHQNDPLSIKNHSQIMGTFHNAQFALLERYVGQGYGPHSKPLNNFVQIIEQEFPQLLLDPVYTAKHFYGIFDMIAAQVFPPHSSILALHTGGIQGRIVQR